VAAPAERRPWSASRQPVQLTRAVCRSLRTSRPSRCCPSAPGGHVVLEEHLRDELASTGDADVLGAGRRVVLDRGQASISTRHQLDAVAVVRIPPRALASPAARAPRRPGSAIWRHLIDRLIPIPVKGPVLLAGSATAASGLDWPQAEVRHGGKARAVRDGRHRAQPCERSGRGSVRSGRCGGVGQRGYGATPWSSAKPRRLSSSAWRMPCRIGLASAPRDREGGRPRRPALFRIDPGSGA
jgi:hypothetical protein